MIVWEAKPNDPSIFARKVEEIKGQRVYFIKNGKRQFEMTKTSWSAIFPTREEAKQYCIDYANREIANLNVKLERAKNHLDNCNNL